jgi:hypothetical protein
MFQPTLVIIRCLKLSVENAVIPICDSDFRCAVASTRSCISWCWMSLTVVLGLEDECYSCRDLNLGPFRHDVITTNLGVY